jgi:hypothetical protein
LRLSGEGQRRPVARRNLKAGSNVIFIFGFGITLGFAFAPWGWGTTRIVWVSHDVIIAGARWGRTWANRGSYVHHYAAFHPWTGPRGPEQHKLVPRSDGERRAAREGRAGVEDHHVSPGEHH